MVREIHSFAATYNLSRDSCLGTCKINLFVLFSPIVMLKLLLSMGRRKSPFIRSNPSLMVKKLPMTINSQSKTKKFCASVGPKPVGNISINSESCSLCACFITKITNRLLPSLALLFVFHDEFPRFFCCCICTNMMVFISPKFSMNQIWHINWLLIDAFFISWYLR